VSWLDAAGFQLLSKQHSMSNVFRSVAAKTGQDESRNYDPFAWEQSVNKRSEKQEFQNSEQSCNLAIQLSMPEPLGNKQHPSSRIGKVEVEGWWLKGDMEQIYGQENCRTDLMTGPDHNRKAEYPVGTLSYAAQSLFFHTFHCYSLTHTPQALSFNIAPCITDTLI
jgi:hypothetical protein